MARVNLTIPDDVVSAAREAGFNLSAVASSALADAVERRRKAMALGEYLADLDREMGRVPEDEAAAARAWADGAFGPDGIRESA